jgi:fumarate hydratase subunit beta
MNSDSPVVTPLGTPLTDDVVRALKVGDRVLLSGVVYTARDAAHKRLVAALMARQDLPIPISGQIIYYVGPSPTPPGKIIGSAGPTTAGRVDPYTPSLLACGLKGMIGKGKRSAEVRQAIVAYSAVYFVIVGGAGALIAQRIKKAEVVAYPDLGPEAIYRLEVEDLPMIVANDAHGGDLYEISQARYRREGIAR